jgi:3-oxoacyl-[acyl-carrier protein] reductase
MRKGTDLRGKVAIVTGSARGIGFSIASRLAENGASIILNGINDSVTLESQAKTLAKTCDVPVIPVLTDVSVEDGAQELVKVAYKEFRRLDVMVNNAGVLRDGLIGMIQPHDIEDTLRINLRGVILGTQAAARLMVRARSGSIINIASIIGRYGNRGQIVYAASKAGVIGATYSAAKELGSFGIRVNAIAPGFIETDMTRGIKKEVYEERVRSVILGRIGQASDVADAAWFFSSDLSGYVTGQVLGVDGGMLI